MYQLLVACLSFLVIPVLIKKKFKLSQTIVMASLVLGVTSGIGFTKFGDGCVFEGIISQYNLSGHDGQCFGRSYEALWDSRCDC